MKTCLHCAAFGLAALLPLTSVQAAAVPDRLTPSDAELVVQVNVRQMLQTPLAKKHALDPLKSLLKRSTETTRLLRAAGLDPFKDIDTISLCTSGRPLTGGKLLVVVRGSFTPDKVRAAADDYAQKHPDRLKNITNGDVPMWEIHSDDKSFYAAFADDKTLVITATTKDTAAVIHRAGQSPQQPSAAMQAALAHLKGDDNMWLALVATEEIKQLLKSDTTSKHFAAALQSVTGALKLRASGQNYLSGGRKPPETSGTQGGLRPPLRVLSASSKRRRQVRAGGAYQQCESRCANQGQAG
jgi:hypothetical protein